MLKYKLKNFFLEEDTGSGSGSTVADILGPVGQDASNTETEAEPDTETETETETEPAPTLVDAKSLVAEFFKQNPASVPGAGAKETEKPATPEEIAEAKKQLKYWEPTPEFVAKFGNLETQQAAFSELRDGLMTQFVTIVNGLLKQQHQQWDERFTPVQSMIAERQEAERETRFNTAYPELATDSAKQIMAVVGQKIHAAGGFAGLSEKDAFAKLAKESEKFIQGFNPAFKLSGAVQVSPKTKKSSTPAGGIPVTSNGGGGGGGNGGSAPVSGLPRAVSLLPKVRS